MDNAEMIERWNGEVGEHWVAESARYDRMSERFAELIVEMVAPQPGERFLDIGCGNGALTLAVASRVLPAGRVTGVDISGPMLAVAAERARSEAVSNVTFVQADAQSAELGTGIDAVVSRFGVMFFADPVSAFTNLGGALRRGGRLGFTCWQEVTRSEWIMVPAMAALDHIPMPSFDDMGGPGPFALADPDFVRQVLTAAGFTDIEMVEVIRPMYLGDTVEDVVSFLQHTDFAEILFAGAEPAAAQTAWVAVADALAAHTSPEGIHLNGAGWLVTAQR